MCVESVYFMIFVEKESEKEMCAKSVFHDSC